MVQSKKVFSKIIGYEYAALKEIVQTLKSKEGKTRYYYSYEKKKPNGKSRTISPSCNELKDIQNRLVSRVFKHVQFPYYVTGSLSGRSGAINAKLHAGKKYHLQTDLVSFFTFVNSQTVYNSLLAIGFSADVARIITLLTTHDGHLPQGAPTSPFLANLAGLKIDNVLLKYCKEHNIVYSRYVDDITFSSDLDFKQDIPFLLESILSLGYLYSHKKTIYKLGNIQVTGCSTGLDGIAGTTNQHQKIASPQVSRESRNGTMGYLQYVESINQNFDLQDFRNNFSDLTYPEKLWPQAAKRVSS